MRNKTGLRRLRNTVSLICVRCSGAHHGGCQAECQILWKDSWLERLSPTANGEMDGTPPQRCLSTVDPGGTDRSYVCQMTRLWEASRPLSSFDFRQDIRPLFYGNIGVRAYLIAMLTRAFNNVQALRGGAGYPWMPQFDVVGEPALTGKGHEGGEPVVVRTKGEIARTLRGSKHRGLWFDREMIRFCGQPGVVRQRVSRVIHEGTGRMIVMRTPCVTLQHVVATGEFLRLCPQHEYPFWRDVWLADATRPPGKTAVANQ